jgi:single-stranded-DNA-specific exonuclease
MKNFERAVDQIVAAIKAGEKFGINGDFDVDGTTAVARMVRLFRDLKVPCEWEIPDRFADGYGLSERIVQRFMATGCQIVLLFDHGVRNQAEIAILRRHGIKVIVFDHHTVGDQLPDAVIVDPAQSGCGFSEYKPCASGLALFLHHRLSELLTLPPPDGGLSALGTIADMVPLVGPNRTIAAMGLEALRRGCNKGIWQLAAQLGRYPGTITSTDVAYHIGPAINAAGRLGSARRCVELMIGDDELELQKIARELVALNESRKEKQREQLIGNYDRLGKVPNVPAVLVSSHESHHQGVVGLTAQGLASRYARPAFVFAPHHDGTLKGSARAGSDAYNLAGMLERAAASDTQGVILKYGGHAAAAGVSIRADGLVAFTKLVSEAAREQRPYPVEVVQVVADVLGTFDILTPKLLQDINRLLDPCGQGFSAPKFLFQSVTVRDVSTYTGGRRMLVLEQGSKVLRAFVGPEVWQQSVRPGSEISLIATPAAIYRNDKHHVQLSVEALVVTSQAASQEEEERGDEQEVQSLPSEERALNQLNPPAILRTRAIQDRERPKVPAFVELRDAFLKEMRALPDDFVYRGLAALLPDPFGKDVTPRYEEVKKELVATYGLSALKANSFGVRPEQLEFVRWFFDRSASAILQAPTGSGKTEIALIIASRQRSLGYRTIFCAPTIEIQRQVHARAPQMIDVESTILDGSTSPKKRQKIYQEQDPAFISAIPHAIRNDCLRGVFSFRPTDLLIIDEGHHTSGEYPYVPLIEKAREVGARVLLLSATPGQIQPGKSWDKFRSLKKLVGVEHVFPVNVVRRQPNIQSAHNELPKHMQEAIECLAGRLAGLRAEVLEYIAREGSRELLKDAEALLGATTLTFPSANTLSPLLQRVRTMNCDRNRWDVVNALCGIIELSELYQALAYQGSSGFLLRVLEKRLEMMFPVAAVQTSGGRSFLAPKRSLSLVYSSTQVELAYRQVAVGPFVGLWDARSLEEISGLSPGTWRERSAKERRAAFNQAVSTTRAGLTQKLVRLDYCDHPKERYLMEALSRLPWSKQSIVFVRDRAHAIFLADRLTYRLQDSGKTAVALTGAGSGTKRGLSRERRRENLEDLGAGRAQIVVSTSAGNEGIDFAQVQYGFAYRFSGSPTEALQQWGRVGRRQATGEVVYLCSAPEEHGKFLSILRKVAEFYKMLNQERQAILDTYQERGGV